MNLSVAGCDCAGNYLHHYDQNGSLTCYQEFLQGPCKEGEQYIRSEEENALNTLI